MFLLAWIKHRRRMNRKALSQPLLVYQSKIRGEYIFAVGGWHERVSTVILVKGVAINLTMSSPQTSERRRLKLLRKSDEYRVSNPFRHPRSPPFPQALAQQLRRIEFLSLSAITQLCFDPTSHEHDCPEGILARMHEAVHLQELRYSSMVGGTDLPRDLVAGVEQQQDKAQQEEVVQTKDEMSLNIFSIFDPRDPRREEEFGCDTPQPNEALGAADGTAHGPVPQMPCGGCVTVVEQQYQNYFAK